MSAEKNNDTNKKFIECEVHAIDISKWLEGEKINHDPHDDNFEKHWIEINAAEYRDEWFHSLCRDCIHCEECGYEATERCSRYEKNED